MDKTTPSFFTQFLAQLQATMGKNFVSEKRFRYLFFARRAKRIHGDAMVSTGVLKVGIAIRGPVNRVIKLEPF